MSTILIIGATRGLGASLTTYYASLPSTSTIYATTRSNKPPSNFPDHNNKTKIHWLLNVDISKPDVGHNLTAQIIPHNNKKLDIIIVNAGYFGSESFDNPDWEKEVRMYTTSAIGPVFAIQALVKSGLIAEGRNGKGGKVIFISSEAGSITLRHESEGGGNYGHHASKAALNMVGKLLSLDLKEIGIAIGMMHPGFMRTEMTRGVGFDRFWEDGGAVTPDEAAKSLAEFVEKDFDIEKTGTYWAPRGPRDIGTAEPVLGKNLSTPLELPW
ncbi:oxidoreductase, short chain dehydrogenase/reductase family superfamily [Talaromyces stipitatus ATCC 10500]|uniref:Oxidoreductase, short chain dehydrogenase/reductase family superfamily n=1 Tax=Talaromyces stipitatus (strain ATCC 10500 / CBS 375.48 / QM 6759 / NRRL 1006) TaxID=441959 RepID=B8MJL1_TALSN|nr:oxidoreductase, short chain dehydrogenase/reductase family superfamily [Talaromyces stipitatus ATCC 10500]EED15211.1 oxidoreductase, short chain dehydrogenase/reductase family superfamily [Talaromyces stipitatus ATCC 10500]